MNPWISPEIWLAVHNVLGAAYWVLLVPMLFFSILFYTLGVIGFSKAKDKKLAKLNIKDRSDWPFVTIQIPTKNELVALRCAKRCLKFDYPKNLFEVIIGDDSTDAKVSKIIDNFAKNHKGRIKVTRRGNNEGYKAGNLNYMLKQTKGEVVLVFDSDYTPEPHFLKHMVYPFLEDDNVACVQAKWDYMNIKQNRLSKFASGALMVYHHLLAPLNNKFGVPLLFGSGEAVRTKYLKELGGWKPWSMTEDADFAVKALKAGYKNIYLENLKVAGEVPYTLKGLSRQQKRWAFGTTRVFIDNIKWILLNSRKNFNLKQRFLMTFTLLGYISAPILMVFTALGIGTFMTGAPAPINLYKFSVETGAIIFVNSGFLFATLVAMARESKLRYIKAVIGASVTYGILVSLSVSNGIIKALHSKRMQWYMIEKKGNLGRVG